MSNLFEVISVKTAMSELAVCLANQVLAMEAGFTSASRIPLASCALRLNAAKTEDDIRNALHRAEIGMGAWGVWVKENMR
jgi:hypothetical protein